MSVLRGDTGEWLSHRLRGKRLFLEFEGHTYKLMNLRPERGLYSVPR